MQKKWKAIIAIVIIAVLLGAGFCVWKKTDLLSAILPGQSNTDKVYVQSVASITAQNASATNRYMGVVEAQESSTVNADSSRKVKDILVEEGDHVEEGDKLFTYDTTDEQASLATMSLDIEKYNSQINAYTTQIKDIETQRDKANEKKKLTDKELLEYTTQIQAIQLSIQETQNSIKAKQLEIQKTNNTIATAYVTAKISGTVKAVNDPESTISDSYDSSTSGFIIIEADGDYRVKCTINEQNVWSISEGEEMLIRSRVNDDTWTGTISKIDTETTVSSNNNGYYMSDSSDSTSTKYPFYIKLDHADGLLLGQHLYVEANDGTTEDKDGLWLNDSYICFANDGSAYVWAENENSKLEKRNIEIGEYDENDFTYEIKSGLAETDYIAAPMDYLYEGVACVTDESEVDYTSPMYSQDSAEESYDISGDELYSDGLYSDEMGLDDTYSEDTYSDEIDPGETYSDETEMTEDISETGVN